MSLLQALAVMTKELVVGDADADDWYRHLIGAGLMFIFAFVDYKWFRFYPLEAGVFIDVSGRNQGDFALFKQVQ